MAGKTTRKFALGAIIAAVAGYIAGLLTAPKSGKETRKDIKDTTEKTVHEAEKDFAKVQAELNKLVAEVKSNGEKVRGQAKEQVKEALAKADVATKKAKEIATSIKQGNAKDKDLQSAVKDVTKAIDSLKVYLKK
jgi:gas vesicle protein